MNGPIERVRFATVAIRRTKDSRSTNGRRATVEAALATQTTFSTPNVVPGIDPGLSA